MVEPYVRGKDGGGRQMGARIVVKNLSKTVEKLKLSRGKLRGNYSRRMHSASPKEFLRVFEVISG